ncbi:Putative ABC transporter related protein [Magnetospira sp. QH-2]|nr:Putative ABC transporter related protein [Magnetospira sp. QH-2]
MESSLFRYILRYSKREQIILLLIIAVAFPFLYFSLDLPKTIINEAIGGDEFPQVYAWMEWEQIPFLLLLCGTFLTLVFINGGFKYFINVYRGILAERMLRRMRFQLIERTLRFPQHHFRNLSQGEIVAMVTTETEPLGGFFGEALSLPAFQGGTLITILAFIMIQDPFMGLAAIALYPVQGYIIPKLQRKVNLLGKERVKTVRKLSERLSETVAGIQDVHAHATYHYELADFSDRLGQIFDIRYRLYKKKFFIKFLNNFLAQVTPFFFFSIGGYLVIKGDLSFGALVAVLAAYKDLSSPWKELLTYYQRKEDSRIKYEQLVEQFAPPGMLNETLIDLDNREAYQPLTGRMQGANLVLEDDGGDRLVNGATLAFDTEAHVTLKGDPGNGRSDLAKLLASQITPTSGQVSVSGKKLDQLPRAHLTREITYVDQESSLRSGTIMDNLLYGLKQRPVKESDQVEERDEWLVESEAAGNSPYIIHDDWLDMGVSRPNDDDIMDRVREALWITELEADVFDIGLRMHIDIEQHPKIAEQIVHARARVRELLVERKLIDIVEIFDPSSYVTSATVAENILWGTPVDDTFSVENLSRNSYLLYTLEKTDLLAEFITRGRSIAGVMIELFADLPPGHEFFERFAFFNHEDIPEYQRIINRVAGQGVESLVEADVTRLVDLTFQVVIARHNLFELDDSFREKVLDARVQFARHMPEDLQDKIEFFDGDRYNAASSIQDNILFGKVMVDKAEAAIRAGQLLTEVIDKLELRSQILEMGLQFDVGIGGKRLNVAQRHKAALARSLIKRPRLLIANKALGGLDPTTQANIARNLRATYEDTGLLWIDDAGEDQGDDRRRPFAQTFVVDRGTVRELAANEDQRPPSPPSETQESGKGLAGQAEVLARLPFFAAMDRSTLKLIAFTSEQLTYEPGELLIRQGDFGTNAYVTLEGAVDITVNAPDGEMKVAELGSGEMIGELALLCEIPRTANVKATTKVTALSISKDTFTKLVLQNSAMAAELSKVVASRLVSTLRAQSQKASADSDKYPSVYQDLGLPNALLFEDRKQRLEAQQMRKSPKSSVLTLHWEGPEVFGGDSDEQNQAAINLIAERVKPLLRDADTLAKISDRALGVLAYGTYDEEGLEILKERITGVLETPLHSHPVALTPMDSIRLESQPIHDGKDDDSSK